MQPANPTKPGSIYTVESVWVHPDGVLALDFVGIENGGPTNNRARFWGHDPSRFRKIEPHTPDAEDVETIRLLTGERIDA
jgi:hypothetical protein